MTNYRSFHLIFIVIMLQISQLSAQWQQTNAPRNPSGVYALTFQGDNLYAGIYSNGIYLSTDQGISWTERNNGLNSYAITDFAHIGTYLFVATRSAGIFRSSDSGTSWTSVSSGLNDLEVYSLCTKETKLFAGTGGNIHAGVYLSTDSATSWVKKSDGLTTPASIRALVSNGQYMFVGVYGSAVGAGIFRSSDEGDTWTEVNNGITNRYVWKLAVNGDNLFAGMDEGGEIYLSTNNGTMWDEVNSGMTDSIITIMSFATSGTNLFAGTHPYGVFLSTNNGANWTAVNTGLTNKTVTSLAVDDTYVYAGTAGAGVGENGVWRRPLAEIITSVDNTVTEGIPSDYNLKQNYPNPFNPITTIRYELPTESFVTLKIFNILGQVVEILVNEEKQAGIYHVPFDATHLSSGVFFYHIQAEKFVQTKKLILIK